MPANPDHHDERVCAPAGFREALAELVQIGMSVARMVGRAAEAETALAEAAVTVAAGVPAAATSLAEAIEADRAASAAGEARRDVVVRAETLAASFAQVSRGIRRTVLLAERLDRGWARPGAADDRFAMAKRQIARGVANAMARDGADRVDSLDGIEDVGDRPVTEILHEICRDLGVDPVRLPMPPGSAPPDGAPARPPVSSPPDQRGRPRGFVPKERPG